MSLTSYGVCIGTLNHFGNDGQAGHWLHGLIFLNLPKGAVWRCAVDVNGITAPVQYRVISDIAPLLFANIAHLKNGFHALNRTPTSGALDYIRSVVIRPATHPGSQGSLAAAPAASDWITVTGNAANNALQPLVMKAKRLFVFGEPFHNANGENGMHNIHMNQGDPPGPHQSDDGIWQDGGTVMLLNDGRICAFLNKFQTQSLQTDIHGLPI